MVDFNKMSHSEQVEYFFQRFIQGLSSNQAVADGFRTANAAHDELIAILKPPQIAQIEKQCLRRRTWEAYCYARIPGKHIGWWRTL